MTSTRGNLIQLWSLKSVNITYNYRNSKFLAFWLDNRSQISRRFFRVAKRLKDDKASRWNDHIQAYDAGLDSNHYSFKWKK